MNWLRLMAVAGLMGCHSYQAEYRNSVVKPPPDRSFSGPTPGYETPKETNCCVHCKTGKPCGAGCIPWGHTCHHTYTCAC